MNVTIYNPILDMIELIRELIVNNKETILTCLILMVPLLAGLELFTDSVWVRLALGTNVALIIGEAFRQAIKEERA